MQSLQDYDCWDAKFYTLWLFGCKFTLEELGLGVIVSIRLHSGIFLTTQTSFLVSPTRELSACHTDDNFPLSTIFFPSFVQILDYKV
jgi:hypothetical protein